MAAEMPVQDVLCEAMEYLSKLGSNLRTRSDNLKEKKIRKDKLTNALAVQKAADKVLLICELSKKSLVNVETGVRKILEHIGASQASSSIGGSGKSSSSKTNKQVKTRDDKAKYYYFDYKSRMLKIKNKISLKHYRSVKVLAKKMTKSMLDKHPVYYDCKLYRIRRKNMHLKNKENVQGPETVQKKEVVTVSSDRTSTSRQVQDNIETDLLNTNENRNSSESDSSNSNKTKSTFKKKARNKIIDSDSDDQDDSKKKYNNGDSVNHDNTKNNDTVSSEHASSGTNENTKITDKSCDEPELKKRKLSKDKHQNEIINLDDSELPDCVNENMNPSSKDDKNYDTDNDSKKPVIKCVSLSKLLKPDVLKKDLKTSVSKSDKKEFRLGLKFDTIKKDKMLQRSKTKKEEHRAQKRKEVSTFKPKKFVINITRLPDLNTKFLIKNNLKKITKEGNAICEINENTTDSIVQQQAESITECIKKSNQSLELMTLSDDDPDDEKLIAQAKEIKNSLLNESDSDIDMDKHSEGQAESDVVKNALLNSNSDQNEDASDKFCTKEQGSKSTEKSENSDDNNKLKNNNRIEKSATNQSKAVSDAAKNYLLDKSDSDNKSENSTKNTSDNDNDLPASLRNQKTPEKDLPVCNDNSAKKSLLSDSSDDKTEVPLNQRKRITPQSKKKSMRENVQAKNDLIRYSSGSETEDDQLRNTLNEIKLSLLEGLSDDENKLKAKNLDDQHRSSQESNSSAEDALKMVKNAKSSDSDASSTIKKISKCKKRLIQSDSDEEKNASSNDEPLSRSSSKKVRTSKRKR